MKMFVIFTNYEKSESKKIEELVKKVCQKRDVQVLSVENVTDTDNAELVISIGGDGTFLEASRFAVQKNLPIVGINLGTLGVLTLIEKENIEQSLDLIINDNYSIQERALLDLKVYKSSGVTEFNFAINDIVISRGPLSRILHLGIYCDDVFTYSFPGDGIIIASPTGSTGYSLSAGGPIVDPDANVLTLTPICPHMFHSKPFITSGNKNVKIEVDKRYTDNASISVDGKHLYSLTSGDHIHIQSSDNKLKMIVFEQYNFYDVLKTKLFKREDGYNNEG